MKNNKKKILFYKLYNSNDFRISGIEPSSVILIKTNIPYSLET